MVENPNIRGPGMNPDSPFQSHEQEQEAALAQMNLSREQVFRIEQAGTRGEMLLETYDILFRIIDKSWNEFTASSLLERLSGAVTDSEKNINTDVKKLCESSDGIADLTPLPPGPANPRDIATSEAQTKHEQLKESQEISIKLLMLYLNFGLNYKYAAPRPESYYKVAYQPVIEQLTPEFFNFIFSKLPGFYEKYKIQKEGETKNWPTLSEQIDKVMRAYTYLAVQSDPRKDWREELKYLRDSEGIKELFSTPEDEVHWLRQLKLDTLPLLHSKLSYLSGRSLDSLSGEEIALLDSFDAVNVFATHVSPEIRKTTEEAIYKLIRGEGIQKNNVVMNKQMEMAEAYGFKLCQYFGIAGYYGTHALELNEKGEATKMDAEEYPWSDASLNVFRVKDKQLYNKQGGYWEGPETFINNAPTRLFTNYLRFAQIPDESEPGRKGLEESLWTKWWKGEKLSDIFANPRLPQWSYRAYWVRHIFLFKEGNGVLPALMGDEWLKSQQEAVNPVFWKDVAKSLYIVTRNYCVVNGDNKEWFTKHEGEVLAEERKGASREEAEKKVINDAVRTMRLSLKKIIVESVDKYWSRGNLPFKAVLSLVLKSTNFMEN